MFPDTFAVELLLAKVLVDLPSPLLGHRNITVKEYPPWVKALKRQPYCQCQARLGESDGPSLFAALEIRVTVVEHHP